MAKKDWKYKARIREDWRKVTKEDLEAKKDGPKVRTSFEYVGPGKDFCLSNCGADDVRHAMDCFRKLTSMTWPQVYQTATKGGGQKTGLHWTPYEDHALTVQRPANVDPDHTIAGIRAGEKYRIFGFRNDDHFYVLWFDPEHEICPV